MKALFACTFVVFSLQMAMTQTPIQQLEQTLGKLLDNNVYQITNHEFSAADKQLIGEATLFKKQRITFLAAYDSNQELADVVFSFPAGSELKISNRAWQKMAGTSLRAYAPKELERSLQLKSMGIKVAKAEQQEGESKIKQLDLSFHAAKNWGMLASKAMTLENIVIDFAIQNPTNKPKRTTNATLTGITKIGSVPVDMSAVLTPKKEELQLSGTTQQEFRFQKAITSMIGQRQIKGVSLPDVMVDMALNGATLTVAPYQKWSTLNAISNWGIVDIYLHKNAKKKDKIEYVAAFQLHDDFKFSNIHNSLGILNKLNLGGQKIVISSAKKSKKEASKIPSLAQIKGGIQQGCSYIANLDLKKLKMDALLAMEKLQVTTLLNKNLKDVTLAGTIETNLSMGGNAKLSGVQFRLTPAPNAFAIALVGIMDTKIQQDLLEFAGGMEVGLVDQSLNFTAVMDGEWNKPLGIAGLKMTDVALQLGASFTTAPFILPNIGLSGQLNIGSFEGAATLAFDARHPEYSMLAAGFNEINLDQMFGVVVTSSVQRKIPNTMRKTMRELALEDVNLEIVPQDMIVLEKSFEQGFRMQGTMKILGWNGSAALDIDPQSGFYGAGEMDPINLTILKIKGGNGKPKPALKLELNSKTTPKVAINGMVSLLGISAETDIEVIETGFKFMVGGKVFNVFKGDIRAKGSNLQRAENLSLQVYMKNDLLNYLTTNVTKSIENSTSNAVKGITKLQELIDLAQKDVDKWDKDILAMVEVVKKDQAADRRKIDKAKADVAKAQKEVNRLTGLVDAKKKELERTPKSLKNATKRGKIRTEIVTYTSLHKTADLGLKGYQKILDGFKHLNVNPYADGRVIALIGKKEGATLILQGEKKALETLKKTLGFTGEVATFIIKNGSDALLNVKEADFKGQLGTLHGGKVSLRADLEWMKNSKEVNFAFDFNDLGKGVKVLTDLLLNK